MSDCSGEAGGGARPPDLRRGARGLQHHAALRPGRLQDRPGAEEADLDTVRNYLVICNVSCKHRIENISIYFVTWTFNEPFPLVLNRM